MGSVWGSASGMDVGIGGGGGGGGWGSSGGRMPRSMQQVEAAEAALDREFAEALPPQRLARWTTGWRPGEARPVGDGTPGADGRQRGASSAGGFSSGGGGWSRGGGWGDRRGGGDRGGDRPLPGGLSEEALQAAARAAVDAAMAGAVTGTGGQAHSAAMRAAIAANANARQDTHDLGAEGTEGRSRLVQAKTVRPSHNSRSPRHVIHHMRNPTLTLVS